MKPGPKHTPAVERYWKFVQRADGCWLWMGAKTQGYGVFWIGEGGLGQTRAPRAAWFFEHGSFPPRELHVCHRCDNPSCVNPAHLFLGTDLANVRDAIAKGRIAPHRPRPSNRGERHHTATMTEAMALVALQLWSDGQSVRQIAITLAVGRQAICHLVYRHTWRHLNVPVRLRKIFAAAAPHFPGTRVRLLRETAG